MTGPEFCFSRLALRGGHSCCMSIKRAEMQEARSGTREQSSAMSVRYGSAFTKAVAITQRTATRGHHFLCALAILQSCILKGEKR